MHRYLFRLSWVVVLTLRLFTPSASAQSIEVLQSGRAVSLRGLSVVTDEVIWASGTKGTVVKSVDGGKTWNWMTVPGYEARDFRDIEAFDKDNAVIMAIAHPAHILRTRDGGNTWQLVYENTTKGMFLDAMDFAGDKNGIVVGDAVKGHLFLARTADGGNTWHEETGPSTAADSTEGCFASSGTNVRLAGNGRYYFVTGGLKSRIISGSHAVVLPFDNSRSSTGANSLAIGDHGNSMIAVGGDFQADTVRSKNCLISDDGGRTWRSPNVPPYGYRSCVEMVSSVQAITCGLNGVDVSNDSGRTWNAISRDSFHACRKAKRGDAVFFSGNNGKIGRLQD